MGDTIKHSVDDLDLACIATKIVDLQMNHNWHQQNHGKFPQPREFKERTELVMATVKIIGGNQMLEHIVGIAMKQIENFDTDNNYWQQLNIPNDQGVIMGPYELLVSVWEI